MPGTDIQDADVIMTRVEIQEVSRYGFDPHEQTTRLTISDSVAHDNTFDGFVLDFIVDGEIRGNVSYDNGRHGFNVVTQSSGLVLDGNVARDNGGAGFVIQRGSEDIPSPTDIVIANGEATGNGREGILVLMSDHVVIEGMTVTGNGTAGIRLHGSSDVTVIGNVVAGNSTAAADGYSEILIQECVDQVFGHVYDASGNLISGNEIGGGTGGARYGVEERDGATGGTTVMDNTFGVTVRGDVMLSGEGSYLIIAGSDGDDVMTGTRASDLITGGAGADTISGTDGNDRLEGGSDDDTLFGGKGRDVLAGGDGNDVMSGNSGNDLLDGGDGNDTLSGNSGNDTLIVSSGSNVLDGGTGDDILIGGGGSDILIGGDGFDTFSFKGFRGEDEDQALPGEGVVLTDTVADFSIGEDVLDFRGEGLDLSKISLSQAGDDTMILAGDYAILLEGVSATELTADSFVF